MGIITLIFFIATMVWMIHGIVMSTIEIHRIRRDMKNLRERMMANTKKRTCLVNEVIKGGEKELKLEKGKIYITSAPLNGEYLTVFSHFWAHNIPKKWFTSGKRYT